MEEIQFSISTQFFFEKIRLRYEANKEVSPNPKRE